MLSTNFAISRISQVSVNVHDLERATAFYRDKLRLQFLFSTGNMSFFYCGGLRIMLSLPEKPEQNHPSSILYFEVPDITQAYQQLLAENVRFEDQPHFIAKTPSFDLWMTFFWDSENNLLSLTREVPHDTTAR